jgi:hypothetical protein
LGRLGDQTLNGVFAKMQKRKTRDKGPVTGQVSETKTWIRINFKKTGIYRMGRLLIKHGFAYVRGTYSGFLQKCKFCDWHKKQRGISIKLVTLGDRNLRLSFVSAN